MTDQRIEQYAKLLVERCVHVERGWQIIVQSSPLARDLVEEVVRAIARRGAYALVRMTYESIGAAWLNEAPLELVGEMSALERHVTENIDAYIAIQAPENTRDQSLVAPERLGLFQQSRTPLIQRIVGWEFPWVGCQFPTNALAQDAGMTLREFTDFLYGACLLDWDEVGATMRRKADRFDAAREVHITGEGTDIRVSLDGRQAEVDAGHANMPGGEFFFSPVEDATEGVVTFAEFPACYLGHQVEGVRLVYESGRIVDASARADEEFLIKTLDTDPGARVLGELGIGCNPGITKHMRNTLFDEKMNGTIHMAVGRGFPFIGGKNVSAVHWDMVKDLRRGGTITLDGEVVQRDGEWLI